MKIKTRSKYIKSSRLFPKNSSFLSRLFADRTSLAFRKTKTRILWTLLCICTYIYMYTYVYIYIHAKKSIQTHTRGLRIYFSLEDYEGHYKIARARNARTAVSQEEWPFILTGVRIRSGNVRLPNNVKDNPCITERIPGRCTR